MIWADVMSDDEEGVTGEVEEEDDPDEGTNEEDACDQLLRHFPVPGEI